MARAMHYTTRRTGQRRAKGNALRILLEATTALNAAVTENEVIRALAEPALALCDAQYASIGLRREQELQYFQEITGGRGWQEIPYVLPDTGTIIGHVIATAASYRCNDLADDPLSDHAYDALMGFHSQLAVPVLGSDGAVLGVVSLYNKRRGPFVADEVVLETLAAQAAIAVERSRSRAALARTAERHRALMQHASDLVLILDATGRLQYVSPASERLLGYAPAELQGTDAFARIHVDDAFVLQVAFAQAITRPGVYRDIEYRAQHRDGSWRAFEAVATNLLAEPSVAGVVVNARDVTERKRHEEQLRHQAFFDGLTGLPNRALFLDRLAHALAGRAAGHGLLGVLSLDLDGFKVVNDSLGHSAGDALLVAVAARLKACLRPEDTIARFGGDEFVVLLEHLAGADDAGRLTQRLLDRLREPFHIAGREVFTGASIGLTLHPAETAGAAELLREADLALYRAKAAGKNRAVVYDPSLHARAMGRLELETDLQRAVERGELRVYYQPEVDPTSGRIVGMEALVRWQHPVRGLVLPGAFIPLAEETGQILNIGAWVLEEACRQARAWQELRPDGPPLLLSVNLSARELQYPEMLGEVAAILRRCGFAPGNLRLEITETTAMQDIEATLIVLRALKGTGVRLAIDDFGTGYSSLSYLRRLPVDTVKIDQSFVREVVADPATETIIQAVTNLAHALGMDVTAEGVETDEQLRYLRALRCDHVQGYLFSRPVPAAAMERLLARAPARPLVRQHAGH